MGHCSVANGESLLSGGLPVFAPLTCRPVQAHAPSPSEFHRLRRCRLLGLELILQMAVKGALLGDFKINFDGAQPAHNKQSEWGVRSVFARQARHGGVA
jgi:hypothetical protein